MVITSDNSAGCSGCTACKEVCPVGAINFIKDREGFNVPIVKTVLNAVDVQRCVQVKMKGLFINKSTCRHML